MLEHRYRFHGYGSLRRVYQQGKVIRHSSLTLRSLPNPNRVHSRVVVIVSKKVYKHAVRRNRIRRRIYEIVRSHWDEINHPADIAISVFGRETLIMPQKELEKAVTKLLKAGDLLKK